jgi:hypothetical protein
MQHSELSKQALRGGLLALLACCASGPQAAEVENLYTATVEIANEASDPRAAAQADAMAEVLVRVTGDRAAAFAPELARLLETPGRFVASYGLTITGEAQVRFLPSEIERELTFAGWPVCGAERPLSVFWIAVTDQFGEQAILSNSMPPGAAVSDHMQTLLSGVRDEIETIATQRGLPWALPDFVTAEHMARTFDDVWRYSFDSLYGDSNARQADATVIGRVRESIIGTDVEWLLQSPAFQGSLPGTGIVEGMHWLADSFAQQYCSTGGPRTLTMRISGIRDFDSYARVLAYLESVTMLSDVNVESWSAGELLLRAESRGDADVLTRTFNLDTVLRERDRNMSFPGPVTGMPGTALELTVVPERSLFGTFDSEF